MSNDPNAADHHPSCREDEEFVCENKCKSGFFIDEDGDTQECDESHGCNCNEIWDGLAEDAILARHGL